MLCAEYQSANSLLSTHLLVPVHLIQEQELKSSVSRMGMQLATVNSELQTALSSLTKEQDASMKAKYIATAAEVNTISQRILRTM
jgi:hypothetical protein